jgi:hypothetical protein
MYLYLLEFTYAVMNHKTVETWLAQAHLGGALISVSQYHDEMLAVLASEQSLGEEYRTLHWHPAISSCVEKYRAVYRIVTAVAPKLVLSSFPLRAGEEWYVGTEKIAYLCVQLHPLGAEQISWLANNKNITAWQDRFDLTSMLVRY